MNREIGSAVAPLFPPQLLDAPPQQRSKYFKSVCVSHPRFDTALQEADRLLNPCLTQRFVLLVGPTGVGKSALLHTIVNRRTSRREDTLRLDACRIPAICLEAEAPDEGSFNFRSLHFAMLAEMQSALIEDTLEQVDREAGPAKVLSLQVEFHGRKATKDALRQRVRTSLLNRNVEVCCIDEARHIFAIGKERYRGQAREMFLTQATKLKSLINKTPTSLLLAGAYDLFALSQASGQLARRTRLVHFESYGTSRDDLKGFCKGLLGLLAHLPARHDIDPIADSAEICLHTAGCVGIANDLLDEALVRHCEDGVPLDIALLRGYYLSANALTTIRREMTEGAKQVNRLLSNAELCAGKDFDQDPPPQRPPAATRNTRTLKPGDTTPSHRADAAGKWGPRK
jgi:hypothetical protein